MPLGMPLVCHWYATGMPLVCHWYASGTQLRPSRAQMVMHTPVLEFAKALEVGNLKFEVCV